ncbi:MAG: VPLPA-CTERM sorting domain-containing protein [Pseudomonadota bacterium]
MVRSVLLGAFTLIFSVSVASALTVVEKYDVMSYNSGNHSLYMNGSQYHFLNGAKFVRYDNGTGKLTGTATLGGNALSAGYQVSLDFGNFRDWTQQMAITNAPHAKGTQYGDQTTWTYMDLLMSSTLSGINGITETYNLIMKPLAYGKYTFQYGQGANDKNTDFGMSGWFFTKGANGGPGAPCGSSSTCDFNLKLTSVPLPAGIALLPVGLAVLAGMRMRRRMAA